MRHTCHYSKMFTKSYSQVIVPRPLRMSRMKLLAYSHLWWPRLDLDLEKLAKCCTAGLGVNKVPGPHPLHP